MVVGGVEEFEWGYCLEVVMFIVGVVVFDLVGEYVCVVVDGE